MDITLNTYLLKIKKKIHYAIVLVIIAVTFQFFLNHLSSKKINYSLDINLYKLIALTQVTTDIIFPIANQIQNLVYKVEYDANNSKVSELENIECSYGNNLFTCTRESVAISKGKKKDFFKLKLEEIVKERLSKIFQEEIILIDDKINSINELYEKVKFTTYPKDAEIASLLELNEIAIQIPQEVESDPTLELQERKFARMFEKIKLMKDKQYFELEMKNRKYFEVQPLIFLKSSLVKYSSELESTPIKIVVSDSSRNTNYV